MSHHNQATSQKKILQDWSAEERFLALQETHSLDAEALVAWCRERSLSAQHLADWKADFCEKAGAVKVAMRELRKGSEKNKETLLSDLRGLIEQARKHAAQTVNSTLTLLYWNVGRRIQREVLQDGRAEYGEQIVATLSTHLVSDYGQGFGVKNLARMIQFAEVFPDEQIVVSLIRQLSWTHIIALIPLKRPLEREFYQLARKTSSFRARM